MQALENGRTGGVLCRPWKTYIKMFEVCDPCRESNRTRASEREAQDCPLTVRRSHTSADVQRRCENYKNERSMYTIMIRYALTDQAIIGSLLRFDAFYSTQTYRDYLERSVTTE